MNIKLISIFGIVFIMANILTVCVAIISGHIIGPMIFDDYVDILLFYVIVPVQFLIVTLSIIFVLWFRDIDILRETYLKLLNDQQTSNHIIKQKL